MPLSSSPKPNPYNNKAKTIAVMVVTIEPGGKKKMRVTYTDGTFATFISGGNASPIPPGATFAAVVHHPPKNPGIVLLYPDHSMVVYDVNPSA